MVLLMAAATCRALADAPADLVVTGGKVVTMDPRCPVAEAIAVRGERIVAVGSVADVAAEIGPDTRVLAVDGCLVIPGFIEGHGHFLGLGQSKQMLNCAAAASWDEIVAQVAQAAGQRPAGTWILGRGWHQSKWSVPPSPHVEGTPTHEALSRAAPHHPVLLTHASGHMCIVNAKALELAAIDAHTVPPPGGEILRDAAGQPTGVLRENAMELVDRARTAAERDRTPRQQREEYLRAIELASAECLRYGVTTFCDAGAPFNVIDVYRDLAAAGTLQVRLWVMVGEDNDALAERLARYRLINAGHHHLTVRAVKRLIDGALGSHGAWLLEPYADLPTSRGLNTLALDELERTAELCLAHDCQLCVHAIGDRANREVLDLYARVLRGRDGRGLRWRIEHAQHLHPHDLPRFAELGVIAAMQSIHATSDGPFVVARLGERRAREGAYAWKSLLESGAVIANGSDVPVEPIDPLAGFYAAVTRRMADGVCFFPAQCMTREQALRSFTRDAAYAACEDDLKGSLTPGKLADLVVLSQDILTIPEEALRDTEVRYTIVGGQVRYARP
ncbi:MAG: amidohydrolase [Pirellulaceae bacterium]|jgi:hypothetical protein|nr:amidohydrolase [Pirellulaceae bacterium]